MRASLLCFSTVLLLCPAGAIADDAAPAVAPDVVTVSSASWPGHAPGAARVVVVERGYEHVSSEVHAQWLRLDDAAGVPGWLVASSRVLVPAGLHRIDSATWSTAGQQLQLVLSGRRTYEPDIVVRCVFELSDDGRARTLDPCGE